MENQEKVLNSAEEAKIYTQSDMNNITSKMISRIKNILRCVFWEASWKKI